MVTPEQIEAAAEAINVAWRSENIPHTPNWKKLAEAALTAAAEVDRPTAFQVAVANAQIRADERERCARVADEYQGGGGADGTSGIHRQIAAAIRKGE